MHEDGVGAGGERVSPSRCTGAAFARRCGGFLPAATAPTQSECTPGNEGAAVPLPKYDASGGRCGVVGGPIVGLHPVSPHRYPPLRSSDSCQSAASMSPATSSSYIPFTEEVSDLVSRLSRASLSCSGLAGRET